MVRQLFVVALLASCGNSGGFPDAAIPDTPASGTFSLTWTVVDQNNAPLDCDRIASQSMTVLPHHKDFEGGNPQLFTCKGGMGTSQQVFGGLYDLNFELSGTFGLLARGATQFNVNIPAGTNTVLDPITFQVEAIGSLALNIASGATGGNCGAANAGGAGIDGFSITLNRNSDVACAPLMLTIAQGATQPGGTYMIDCTTPVVAPCIEADQTITASGISSDAYTIHIKGKVGQNDCYLNNDSIQVPPLQKTLTRVLNLAPQTGPGC